MMSYYYREILTVPCYYERPVSPMRNMILKVTHIMSFTNLTPDVNPDGSRFTMVVISGIRYFYFTFIPTTPSIDVFLKRNIYNNEESITRIFTQQSPISLLTQQNLSNVNPPCVFINGQITINRPSGFTYQNLTTRPDFKLNNLIVGTTYILESRTIYNDPAMDFGAYIKDSPLTYIKSSTLPITPVVPTPLPLPIPPPPVPAPPVPGGFPSTPSGLVATNASWGVSLTWNSTPQTTRYLIYREGLLISSSETPNYIDSQVISGNPYTYAVSSLNSAGESGQSQSRSITPMFSFTCVIPNRTPIGAVIANSNTRYYYFLFTPITPSIEVTCYNGNSSTMKAIVGVYDTTDPSINYLIASNLVLGSDVTFGPQTIGSLTIDGLSVKPSTNSKFSITLPLSDLTKPTAVIKTYILEIVSYTSDSNTFTSDFCLSFKSTLLNYNSVSLTRGIPSPYVISYDFTGTSDSNYTKYMYPNLSVFQNVKTVLETILTTTTGARGFNRKNDMLVHFTIAELSGDTLGRSSLDKWTADAMRSPDFTYEQSIEFSSKYFTNGYMTNPANFNGSGTVNSIANINLFNILLHEMIHGLGFFYTTSADVGWNSFLTDIGTAPWYKGPASSTSLSSYKTYCKLQTLQRIPVEGNYGVGTALSHWDDGSTPTVPVNKRSFNGVYHPAPKYEVMTGFLGSSEYMTGITAGFLKDYGYSVNLVCPYVVAHPFSVMPSASLRVKCVCAESETALLHDLVVEQPPTVYVQHKYYTPVYFV